MSINDKINSLNSELNRINSAKADIASAIAAKGVTVPPDTSIDGYAGLIGNISSTDSDGYYGDYVYSFGLRNVSSPFFAYGGDYLYMPKDSGFTSIITGLEDFIYSTENIYTNNDSVSTFMSFYRSDEDPTLINIYLRFSFTFSNKKVNGFFAAGTSQSISYSSSVNVADNSNIELIANSLNGMQISFNCDTNGGDYKLSPFNSGFPKTFTAEIVVLKRKKIKDINAVTSDISYCPSPERIIVKFDSVYDGYYHINGKKYISDKNPEHVIKNNNGGWELDGFKITYGDILVIDPNINSTNPASLISSNLSLNTPDVKHGGIMIANPTRIILERFEESSVNQSYVITEGNIADRSTTHAVFTGAQNSDYTIVYNNGHFSLQKNGVEIASHTPSIVKDSLYDNLGELGKALWYDIYGNLILDTNTTIYFGNDTETHENESPDEDSNSITVSGFGIATLQKYNTTYQLSSDGKYWKADGASAGVLELRIYHGNHPGNDQLCWIFGDDTGTMEAFIYSTNSDPMSIVGSQSCQDAYGTDYTLTITAGGNSGGAKNYDTLTISGCGETSANGTYTKTSESDSSIKYTQDGGYGELTITKEFNAGGTGYTALIQWNSKPCYNCGFDTLDDLETVTWTAIAASEPLPTVTWG